MRRLILAGLLMIGCASLTLAQDPKAHSYPKFEVFGGYSANGFIQRDSNNEAAPPNVASHFDFGTNSHLGFETSFVRNITGYLGIKADYAMYFVRDSGLTGDGQPYHVNMTSLYATIGPEIKARNRTRLTPFAHTLLGVAHSGADFIVDTNNPNLSLLESHSRRGFAMMVGGGFDFRVSKRISIRTVIDYAPTFFGTVNPGEGGRQGHLRFSMGIVFHRMRWFRSN